MKTKLFLTGIALMAIVALTHAQTTTAGQGKGTLKGTRTAYVDNNNNGTCDNFENRTTVKKANANRNGAGNGYCRGNGQGKGKGNGAGKGTGQGKGQGNFIDTNKNGICDNRE